VLHHGPNNVSRWMTWLPISLKNAAKCDKWYQLQNHSITESLNANGAWEKLFMSDPRACRISVSNKKNQYSPLLVGIEYCAFFQQEPISGRNAVIRIRSDLVLLGSFIFGWGELDEPRKNNQRVSMCCAFFLCNSFTDLSAAGLPAELKHITQRRKRKQP
jgi:hypothetical protein